MAAFDQVVRQIEEQGGFNDKPDDQKARNLRNSLDQSYSTNPDQAVENDRLSSQAGLPSDYVERHPDEARKQAYINGVPIEEILSDAPTTADYLANPEKAKAAHDDIDMLSQIEKAWRATPQVTADIARSLPGGAVEGTGMSLSGIGRGIEAVQRQFARGADFILPESMDKFIWADPNAPEWVRKFGEYTDVAGSFRSTGDVFKGTGERIKPPEDRQNLATDIAGGVGQVAGQIAGYLINPVAGSAMLFGQGVEQQGMAQDELGFDESTLSTDAALLAGGGVTMALERIGLDFLINRVPPAIKNKVLRNLTDVTLAGGSEALQETVEGIAQNIVEYANYNPEAEIFEGLEREALAAGGTGAVVRSIVNALTPGKIRLTSDRDAAKLDQVITGVEQSRLTGRDPQRAREYLEALAESTGSDTIFLDQEGADMLFQRVSQETPEIYESEVFQSIVDQYQDAYETGAKIQIKLSDLPELVQTGVVRELQPYMVTDIDALSPAQMQDESILAEIEAIREMDAEQRSSELEVFNDVLGQELARGQDRSTAEQRAMLYEATFKTLAKRMDGPGQSAFDIYQRFNPTIRDEVDPAVQAQINRIDQMDLLLDTLREGNLPQDQDIFGESLVEFIRKEGGIRDDGGEMAALDAVSLIRPNVGKTLDDLAERAVEEGFLSERDVNDLVDRIDNELRGNPTYRLGRENEDLMNRRADLERLQELLDRAGVDLAQMTNEDVRAFLDQSPQDMENVLSQTFSNDEIEFLLDVGALTAAEAMNAYEQAKQIRESRSGSVGPGQPPQERRAQPVTVSGTVPRESWAENTRVTRNGRPAIVYRGSAFGPVTPETFSQMGAATGRPSAQLGVWFTSDRNEATGYGDLYEYQLDIQNPKVYTTGTLPVFDSAEEYAALAQSLQAEGYDGIAIDYRDVEKNRIQFIPFSPEQVIEPADGDTFYQFAGVMSETADTAALEQAVKMKDGGASSEQIRRQTGWHVGPDNKWRYEISDNEADWNDVFEADDTRDLGAVLYHPKLFEAYPWLKRYSVWFTPDIGDGMNGSFNQATRTIKINANRSAEQMLSTLLHEVQHAIQHAEDFGRGGNTDQAFTDQIRNIVERHQNDTRLARDAWKWNNRDLVDAAEDAAFMARMGLLYDSMDKLIDYANHDKPSSVFRNIRNQLGWLYADFVMDNPDLRRRAQELDRKMYELPKRHKMKERNAFLRDYAWEVSQFYRDLIPEDMYAEFREDPRQRRSMLKALEREAKKAQDKLGELVDLEKRAKVASVLYDKHAFSGSYDIYRALAGEVEARNTQKRQKLDDAQRRMTSPDATADVGRDRAIVVFGDGEVELPATSMSQDRVDDFPEIEGEQLYQFAGPRSQTSDLNSLATAKQMISDGENPEKVRKETGWFIGNDNKWRYEITDQDAELRPEFAGVESFGDAYRPGLTVGDVLKHDRLYAAYPGLQSLSLGLTESSSGVYSGGSISLNGDLSSDQIATVLLHELQHGIQNIEGFATGGSPMAMGGEAGGEVVNPEFVASLNKHNEILRKYGYPEEQMFQVDDILQNNEDLLASEIEKQQAWMLDALEESGDPTPEALMEAEYSFPTDIYQSRMPGRSASELYGRLAGEIEARNTQARQSMTEAERAATPASETADIADSDAIVVFSDGTQMSAPRTVAQGGTGGKERIRGMFDRASNTITLTKDQNLSTFLHESGHFFLEVMRELAPESKSIQDDLVTLESWWQEQGAKSDRERHEMFASGFETYLMEGKAPTPELQSMFGRFRLWLTSIYKVLTGPFRSNDLAGVEISDEVRGVMDRLVATQDEIERATKENMYGPFPGEALGLTPEQAKEYAKLVSDAEDEALTELTGEAMREYRRETEKWWKDQLAETTEEVRAEVDQLQVYTLRDVLTGHNDQDPRSGKKLSYASVSRYLDKDQIKPLTRQGLVSKKGELDADTMSMGFGYTNGGELVLDLINSMTRGQRERYVKAEAEKRMKDRHGDMINDGSIAAKAERAVHNNKQSERLLKELEFLNSRSGRKPTPRQFFKEAARQTIDATAIKEIKPHVFRRQEQTARTNALRAAAKGDFKLAATEQHRALRQHYLLKEADRALKNAEKTYTYGKSLMTGRRQAVIQRAGDSYIEQVNGILEWLEFKRVSDKGLNKRQSMRAWLDLQMDEAGSGDPKHSNEIMDKTERRMNEIEARADVQRMSPDYGSIEVLMGFYETRNYRELTPAELSEADEMLKSVYHLAKLKERLLTNQDKRTLNEWIDRLELVIEENANNPKAKKIGSVIPKGQVTKDRLKAFYDMSRTPSNLIRMLDGFEDGGTAWELLGQPLQDAATAETHQLEQANAELERIFKIYTEAELADMNRMIPGQNLTRHDLVSFLLNWGNEQNRQRVMDGENLTAEQVQQLFDAYLTDKDLAFAKEIWTYLETFKEASFELHRDFFGFTPEAVEPAPFVVNGTNMPGGYYPIKYDPIRSARAEQQALTKQGESFAKPLASKNKLGSTQARQQTVNRALNTDMTQVIFRHVAETIHATTHDRALYDVGRILANNRIKQGIQDNYGDHVYKALTNLVREIKEGGDNPKNMLEKTVQWARNNATLAMLGASVRTVILQPFGITNSIVKARLSGMGTTQLISAYAKYMKSPIHYRDTIKAKSDYMVEREQVMNAAIARITQQIERKGKLRKLTELSMVPMQKMQFYTVDAPLWLASYEHVIDMGFSEDQAVKMADQAVRDAQGGGNLVDTAQGMRGGPWQKLFTNFLTYMMTTFNLFEESRQKRKRGDINWLEHSINTIVLASIPAVFTTMLNEFIAGEDDDEAWHGRLLREQLSFIMSMNPLTAQFSGVASGFDYSGPQGTALISKTYNLVQQLGQGDPDAALAKSAIWVLGLSTGLPAAQINRTIFGIGDAIESDENAAKIIKQAAFGPER